jgi:hypothetical protein
MKKLLISLMAVMILSSIGMNLGPTEVHASDGIETRAPGQVIVDTAHLRSGPGTNYVSLGHVHRGDVFNTNWWEIGADGHIWLNVRMTSGQNSGRTGWIRANLTR